jgi:NAD(P)-dependent dehydrogenase (short-subunit alcohol dehydrogenase family)
VDLGLAGRVVLITGAGGGAGPTVAARFAAEGAFVALHERKEGTAGEPTRAEGAAADIAEDGGRAMAVAADLGSADAITAMIGRIEAELGPVAVLVNATSAYRSQPFEEIGDDDWDALLDDMLGATFRVCRAVVPGMKAGGFGRIVNIAARSGLFGVARAAHYAAAKAGIVGLTASLAKELGPNGILANAVAPTQILTHKGGEPSIPDEAAERIAKGIPLRRLATPDDLAGLVLWLGSAANTYVSGETVTLGGGAQS